MIKKKSIFILSVLFLSLFASCDWIFPSKSEDALAKVGDKYLYLDDIEGLTANQSIDSSTIINNYIESWVNEQLILEKALLNLPEDKVNFEKQLENYRSSLIIYAYENQLIKEKLDTLVTKKQVLDYYRTNPDNFDLKEKLFQVQMVKTPNSAPNKDSIRMWVSSKDTLDIGKLEDYCRSFAKNCIIDTSQWISRSNLLSYLDGNDYQLNMLNKGVNVMEDSLYVSYINLFNVRVPGQIAPVNYVKKQIKEIIRNQRRITLLSEVRKQIFEAASLKGKYEIYY